MFKMLRGKKITNLETLFCEIILHEGKIRKDFSGKNKSKKSDASKCVQEELLRVL
jgi:hypothetical protein